MATNTPPSENQSASESLPRLLLVEDETLQATMLRMLLLDRGLLVIHAQNLWKAMDLVDHEQFAAAILDITLADTDVYPLAARLRAKRIPFFFASGAEPYQIQSEFADVPLVHKPYRIDQVYALLDRMLSLAESSASR